MKAIVWTKYGSPDGLQLREVEKPTPQADEVLIRVHAATVTAGDCEIRGLKLPLGYALLLRLFMGIRHPRPTILGQELSGEVVAVGTEVSGFKVGDAVFGTTGLRFGAYAEYNALPATSVAHKPTNLTHQEAAGIPVGALEALHFLRSAQIQPGERVLINGAGGSIGTLGVQLARYYGATVTAVDSGDKLPMLRSIGAEQVLDYQQEDFIRSGQQWDVIFDVTGKRPFGGCLQALKPGGRYLLSNAGLMANLRARWPKGNSKRVILGTSTQATDDLLFIKGLVEAGKLKPVIDRHYPLEQLPEAHHYVETGRKQGNVVITVV